MHKTSRILSGAAIILSDTGELLQSLSEKIKLDNNILCFLLHPLKAPERIELVLLTISICPKLIYKTYKTNFANSTKVNTIQLFVKGTFPGITSRSHSVDAINISTLRPSRASLNTHQHAALFPSLSWTWPLYFLPIQSNVRHADAVNTDCTR